MHRHIFTRQRIVIVAKTRMRSGICVGGIIDSTGRPVRLLPVGEACHPPDTGFEVGEIWDIEVAPRQWLTPPHVEDHDARSAVRVGLIPDLATYLRNKIKPVKGTPDALFQGRLAFRSSGTAYIDIEQPLPPSSVDFWVLPRALDYNPYNDKARYRMAPPDRFVVSYVGVAPPIPMIPKGTLVRVSLARPWTTAEDPAEHTRCSLQLSGWYL